MQSSSSSPSSLRNPLAPEAADSAAAVPRGRDPSARPAATPSSASSSSASRLTSPAPAGTGASSRSSSGVRTPGSGTAPHPRTALPPAWVPGPFGAARFDEEDEEEEEEEEERLAHLSLSGGEGSGSSSTRESRNPATSSRTNGIPSQGITSHTTYYASSGPGPSGKALVESAATDVVPPSNTTATTTNGHSHDGSAPGPREKEPLPWHMYEHLPKHHLQADGTPDYLKMILSADIYSLVKQTPLNAAVNLSGKTGCQILLKREDLQPVFSFKLRGAFNMMRQLSPEQKWKGVIACSAGNHAQGVALSGAHLSIPCTIVMPVATPTIKTANVARLGAKVVLHGADFDEAKAECARLAAQYGLQIIPPFDHPQVIAGQGTIAVEVCRQTDMSQVDAIFCCVGGGGLLAGTAAYIKRICPPHVKVIGVETYDADALTRSLEAGSRVTLDEVGLFADGTAVKVIGEETFRVCEELVDGLVRVDNDAICAAIRDVFEDTRSIPEPSGALAVAGMKQYIQTHGLQGSGKTFVGVVSGANMNFGRLRFVAERAELGEKKEALLQVEIPERPGSFLELHSHIHPRPLTEFSYRYNDKVKAQIFLSFNLDGKVSAAQAPASATPLVADDSAASLPPAALAAAAAAPAKQQHQQSSQAAGDATARALAASAAAAAAAGPTPTQIELQTILTNIRRSGFKVVDISDNEFAKTHARYMIGGRTKVPNERVFRFEFPERPGALRKFLTGLRTGWNVSLFHYRNYGADTGKVLAGLQVPPEDNAAFQHWIDFELGYAYVEATNDPVYKDFFCS